MLLESTLVAWLSYELARYRDTPTVLRSVFLDGQHLGVPTTLSAGQLVDISKRWIPHVFAGGTLILGDETPTEWPILDNGHTDLTLDGDPSPLLTPQPLRYIILIPDTARFQTWLTTNPLPIVVTAFAQIPSQVPCLTLRLEQDVQDETYLGEYVLPGTITTTGVEVQLNVAKTKGRFVCGIWTQGRDASLWLYALLQNLFLGSQQTFASWGLSDGTFQGLDVDPVLGFVPQYPDARHFAMTLSRFEVAINLAQLDAIDRTRLTPYLAYAPLWLKTLA